MKLLMQLLLVLSIVAFAQCGLSTEMSLVTTSRANAVRISIPSLKSGGTGFFIDEQHVVTAFHVIGKVNIHKKKDPPEAEITMSSDITIILATGESIPAQVVSPKVFKSTIKLTDPLSPSIQLDLVPVLTDFSILKLNQKPKTPVTPNPLLRGKALPDVGSEIIFSGYPLDAPTMLTHKGMISGITDNQAIICIEAPINKGNSGGALLNEDGDVIGIITNREGGISKGLDDLALEIKETQKHGGVALMGVDPLAAIQALIGTLDRYISPGIGYARTIKHVTDYLDRNPEILK